MIRCDNCMEFFGNKEDLSIIVEQQEFYDGNWHTTDRYIYDPEMDLKNTEKERYELFKGCPFCHADEYLIELTSYKK